MEFHLGVECNALKPEKRYTVMRSEIPTLKEHEMVRTFAIFQRILITMDVCEISIFFPSK